jgi:hypothetical protein
MELTQPQLQRLLQRFPSFELSYETLTHKKVPSNYDICLGVPAGRKYFLWHTFYRNRDVSYLLELNKDKRIVRATVTHTGFSSECHIGTILYGSLVVDQIDLSTQQILAPFFVIEDVYFYKGVPLKHLCFAKKTYILKELFDQEYNVDALSFDKKQAYTPVYLPYIWHASKPPPVFPYTVHHIQYRECARICPYLNVIYGLREPTYPVTASIPTEIHVSQYTPDFGKPQYKYPTIFRVTADVQYDIYHLYACGPSKQNERGGNMHRNNNNKNSMSNVYYDVAYIPNYKKSVFMNGLFRNIRENRNLDYIEESDDEEDFENTREDKYVDLKKELFMECSFHTKFKRWVPIRVVDKREKVVHIDKLVRASK